MSTEIYKEEYKFWELNVNIMFELEHFKPSIQAWTVAFGQIRFFFFFSLSLIGPGSRQNLSGFRVLLTADMTAVLEVVVGFLNGGKSLLQNVILCLSFFSS